MSKGGGGSQPTTQKSEVDPDIKAAYLSNVDYATDVANQLNPMQYAGFNPQYNAGEQQIMNAAQGGVGMQNVDTAANLTRAGAGYAPMMAGGISAGPAAMSGSTGYNAAQFGGSSAGPAAMSQSAQANMGNIGQYYNPYQRDVIDATMADLEKGRQGAVQQMGQQAMAAKAFGGSRQGVAEALTNQAYGEQAGKTVSQMRAQGFDTAANLMQQDVARQQQTGLSNQAARNQMSQFNAGNLQQAGLSNAAALNAAGQFGAGAMNTASLSNQSAANQAALTNAAAANQMSQFNAGNLQQAGLTNMGALNQAGQFGAGAMNTASLSNQAAANQASLTNAAARNQMSQFNAGNMQQAGLSNMGALNQAGQFGAGAMNTAALSNQSAMNQMNQFNAGLGQQAQLANQAAGMQGAQFRMGAAQQLGQMGQAQTAGQYQGGQAMMGLGQARQGQEQQRMDAQRNLNLERLGLMQGALGLQPANLGGSTTQPMYQNTGANILGGAMMGNAIFPGVGGAFGGALLGLL